MNRIAFRCETVLRKRRSPLNSRTPLFFFLSFRFGSRTRFALFRAAVLQSLSADLRRRLEIRIYARVLCVAVSSFGSLLSYFLFLYFRFAA